ncbi:protein kinase domain-containing protein [Thalassoglobus sp.]|uniref:protein kinase domain-containing protein n=1 Tax=Thalassoglobus sp. TaxID=2795869 RepID=UPI003AA97B74
MNNASNKNESNRSSPIRPATLCERKLTDLADQYNSVYQKDEQPSLDEYLNQLPRECQAYKLDLLNLLLLTDAHYWQGRMGRDISKQDLLELYPWHADDIQKSHVARELDNGRKFEWRIGKFRIEGKISEGGEGKVYKAVDLNLNRTVALKVTHPILPFDWIKTEGQALAELNHPHILRVFEFFRMQRTTFLVTEYIKAASLHSRFSEENPSQKQLTSIAVQLLDAVVHLHEQQICHRDIQPKNVLYSAAEQVKLIDFGLAITFDRLLDDKEVQTAPVGTPPFMAPELLHSDTRVDPRRSDLYSIGATLFWLMAKVPPVEGQTRDEIYDNLRQGRLNYQKFEDVRRSYPVLASHCLQLLEVNPENRPRNAKEALATFRRFEDQIADPIENVTINATNVKVNAHESASYQHDFSKLEETFSGTFSCSELDRGKRREWQRKLVSLYQNQTQRAFGEADSGSQLPRVKDQNQLIFAPNSIADFDFSSLIVISGYVGQGKSYLLKNLAANTANETSRLPVYCELLAHQQQSLTDMVSRVLKSVGLPMGDETINFESSAEDIALFFDGFEEVAQPKRTQLLADLQRLKLLAPDLPVFIGTRPGTELAHCAIATVYTIDELKKDDFFATARELRRDRTDEELQRMFVGDRLGLSDLLTTPALVGEVLRHFRSDRTLRQNTLSFYRDLFDLLVRRHNQSQYGRRRQLTCDFDETWLQHYFEILCFFVYRKYGRNEIHISDLRKQAFVAAKLVGHPNQATPALDDILSLSNLIIEDEGNCRFLHPSVCEYYAASSVANLLLESAEGVYQLLLRQWQHWIHVLSFLSDLDPVRMAVLLELPELRQVTADGKRSYLAQFQSFIIEKLNDGREQLRISHSKAYCSRNHKILVGGVKDNFFREGAHIWFPSIVWPDLKPGHGVRLPVEQIDLSKLVDWLGKRLDSGYASCEQRLIHCVELQRLNPQLCAIKAMDDS